MSPILEKLSPSPLLAQNIQDIKHYGYCPGRKFERPPGEHEFMDEGEQRRSRKDYKHFTYKINDMGFRDNLPSVTQNPIMAFFGCSFTFGVGLDSADNFPHRLSDHYHAHCLNLGVGGAGARHVALTFRAAIRIWPIKIAIVTLPHWSRMLLVDEQGFFKHLHCNAAATQDQEYTRFLNDQHLIFETREAIESIHTNSVLCGVTTILTSWDMTTYELANSITGVKPPNYKLWIPGSTYDPDEYARDNLHPGIKIVGRYVQDMIRYIDNNNLLQ